MPPRNRKRAHTKHICSVRRDPVRGRITKNSPRTTTASCGRHTGSQIEGGGRAKWCDSEEWWSGLRWLGRGRSSPVQGVKRSSVCYCALMRNRTTIDRDEVWRTLECVWRGLCSFYCLLSNEIDTLRRDRDDEFQDVSGEDWVHTDML